MLKEEGKVGSSKVKLESLYSWLQHEKKNEERREKGRYEIEHSNYVGGQSHEPVYEKEYMRRQAGKALEEAREAMKRATERRQREAEEKQAEQRERGGSAGAAAAAPTPAQQRGRERTAAGRATEVRRRATTPTAGTARAGRGAPRARKK